MTRSDALESALAKIAALEAELAEWRKGADEGSVDRTARLRAEAEVEAARKEMKAIRALHEHQLEALKAQHQAALEMATASTQAQIAQARVRAELESVQSQAEAVERERESYLNRLNALAAELSEEIEVLLTFSRDEAQSYYTGRVAREEAAVTDAEENAKRAKRQLSKVQADAQKSGHRTVAEMAQIDMALGLAKAQYHATEVELRNAKTRLQDVRRKLTACRGE